MRELFRERDYTQIGYFQSVLEDAGIPTIVRNRHLTMSGLTEIPIPEFFPALCVVHEEDYVRAMDLISRRHRENIAGADVCGSGNKGKNRGVSHFLNIADDHRSGDFKFSS